MMTAIIPKHYVVILYYLKHSDCLYIAAILNVFAPKSVLMLLRFHYEL